MRVQKEKALKECKEEYNKVFDKIMHLLNSRKLGTQEHIDLLKEEDRLFEIEKSLLGSAMTSVPCSIRENEAKSCCDCTGYYRVTYYMTGGGKIKQRPRKAFVKKELMSKDLDAMRVQGKIVLGEDCHLCPLKFIEREAYVEM